MIRKNSLFCKLFRIKKSSPALFRGFMGHFSCAREACPFCGAKGCCHRHQTYERSIIDFVSGRAVDSTLTILRVKCKGCGHTHAILPDLIVPYASYSLLFLLRVLAEYFLHRSTVEALCRRFSITVSMLYRWKALFLEHRALWLGALDSLAGAPFSFLKEICSLEDYSSRFSSRFVLLTAHSFLQGHKNPADYRQAVF